MATLVAVAAAGATEAEASEGAAAAESGSGSSSRIVAGQLAMQVDNIQKIRLVYQFIPHTSY